MKKEGIKIRIDSQIKKDFKTICDYENISMSNKLHEFILHEIKTKKRDTTEKITTDLFKSLGYNISIVERPFFFINDKGDVLDDDEDGRLIHVGEFRGEMNDFIKRNKDKKIYLHISSCDFPNKKIRGAVIDINEERLPLPNCFE